MDTVNKDDAINVNDSNRDKSDNDNDFPLDAGIDLNERAIIDVIKQNMAIVINRDLDIMEILKGQVEFLKDEIKNNKSKKIMVPCEL